MCTNLFTNTSSNALFRLILYLILLVYMAIGKLVIGCILIAGVG